MRLIARRARSGLVASELASALRCRTMDVSMEKSIGRAIGFMVIVITVFVVGEIWQPDDPVQDQVGAQEDMESGSQPASQLAPPASQPGGDQSPTDGQQAAASG